MLMNRIMGAFTFRKEVYAEVEGDVEFTTNAWLIVAVTSLLVQLGRLPTYGLGGIGKWLIAAIIGLVLSVGGFALAAFVISWVGKQFFKAEVNFGEMVRVLGLAYVWNVVGVLGLLGFIPFLVCILSPIIIVAALAGLVAWAFAAKEALDLDWGPTIITLIIGWVINLVISTVIAGAILTALGVGSAAANALR